MNSLSVAAKRATSPFTCLAFVRWGLVLLVFASLPVRAVPLLLDVAPRDSERRVLKIIASGASAFVLTLSSPEIETPELQLDLLAVAGELVAPVWRDHQPEVHRLSSDRSGVQRFGFELPIPALASPRTYWLITRYRARPTDDWAACPALRVEAKPESWKAALRDFVRRIPSAQLAGAPHLPAVFDAARAESPVVETDSVASTSGPLVWFAETEATEPISSGSADAIWLVFKKDGPPRPTLSTIGTDPRWVITLDAAVLSALSVRAEAQEEFLASLALATTLLAGRPVPATLSP